MRELSIAGFLSHLAGMDLAMRHETEHALEKAARLVEAEAKKEIGHYQDEAGQFAAWAELADSTKDDRVRMGYAENDPLLRTGELRDSIHHAVEVTGPGQGDAVIGSDSDIAVWQELGTRTIPPRSFLGGALVRKSEQVAELLGEGIVKALVGNQVVGGRLGIED